MVFNYGGFVSSTDNHAGEAQKYIFDDNGDVHLWKLSFID